MSIEKYRVLLLNEVIYPREIKKNETLKVTRSTEIKIKKGASVLCSVIESEAKCKTF